MMDCKERKYSRRNCKQVYNKMDLFEKGGYKIDIDFILQYNTYIHRILCLLICRTL